MDILTILLFFLRNFSIPVSIYEYQVSNPIRYIEVLGSNQVIVTSGEETFLIPKGDHWLDLNNYYEVDAFSISGEFKEIRFYYQEELVATIHSTGKTNYQAEDMLLENQYSFYRFFRKQESRVGYTFFKSYQKWVPMLRLSSFVEAIVENPKRC